MISYSIKLLYVCIYRIIAYYIDINTDIEQFVTELRKGRINNKKLIQGKYCSMVT